MIDRNAEITLLVVIAVLMVLMLGWYEVVLGQDNKSAPPRYFKQMVPIACGPANELRRSFQRDHESAVFSGQSGETFSAVYLSQSKQRKWYMVFFAPTGIACVFNPGIVGSCAVILNNLLEKGINGYWYYRGVNRAAWSSDCRVGICWLVDEMAGRGLHAGARCDAGNGTA